MFKTFKVEDENQLNKRIKKTLRLTMVVNSVVDLMDEVNIVKHYLICGNKPILFVASAILS